jgi:hypothetical protein
LGLADGEGDVAVSDAFVEPPDVAAWTATPPAAPTARTLAPAMTALRTGEKIMRGVCSAIYKPSLR